MSSFDGLENEFVVVAVGVPGGIGGANLDDIAVFVAGHPLSCAAGRCDSQTLSEKFFRLFL